MQDESIVELLVVDDSSSDARLVQEALRDESSTRVSVVENGTLALDFLHKVKTYVHAPSPDLILLDLNLPGLDGREVLAKIKKDRVLGIIPVIVFTTSGTQQDIDKAYELRANCYITKPLDVSVFFQTVKAISNFWLKSAKLPALSHAG
jgi:chemotaxis family two-component system response regulator Rcp1